MKRIIVLSAVVLLFFTGCGEPMSNIGLGAGLGAAVSNTIGGAKADLEKREEILVEIYNQGVEDGAAVETLEGLKQQINDTRLAKQTVETGEALLGVDWSDPKQTGGAIGLLTMTVLGWFNRKKLLSVTADLKGKDAAIQKFEGTSEPAVASKLHEMVKEKTGIA
jgi:hypothetical protein